MGDYIITLLHMHVVNDAGSPRVVKMTTKLENSGHQRSNEKYNSDFLIRDIRLCNGSDRMSWKAVDSNVSFFFLSLRYDINFKDVEYPP